MYIKNFETDNKHNDSNNQWFDTNDVNIENNSASNTGAATELFNKSQMVRRAPPPLPAAPPAPRLVLALGQNPRPAPVPAPLLPAFPNLPPLPTLPPFPSLTLPSFPTLAPPAFPTPNFVSIFNPDNSPDFNFNIEIKPNNQKTPPEINQTFKFSDSKPSKQTMTSYPATKTVTSIATNISKPDSNSAIKPTVNENTSTSSKKQEKQEEKSKDNNDKSSTVSNGSDSQSNSYNTAYDISSSEGSNPYIPMEGFQKVDNQDNSNINDSEGGLILLSKNGDGRNAFFTSVIVIIVVFGFLMLSVGFYIHKSRIRSREIDARRQEEEILNTYKNVINNNESTMVLQNKHLKNVISTFNVSPPPHPRNNHRIRPNMYIKSPLGDPDNVITCPSSTSLSEKTSASETASYSSTTADIGGQLDLYTKLLLK